MSKRLILCDCGGSQPIDDATISKGFSGQCTAGFSHLCTRQIGQAAELIAGGDAVIACQQERLVFEELAEELQVAPPGFVDIRDRAGWSEEADRAGAKMAALVAEAMLPAQVPHSVDVISEGTCLIIGASDVAVPLARVLSGSLAVTVLLSDEEEIPADRVFDVVRGRIRRVEGALGGFKIRIDALQQVEPSGRGAFVLTPPQDGAVSACDLVIDVAGGAPLVTAPEKREGYFRADPKDPLAVQKLALMALQSVGTFEKPLYVQMTESLCAHSRAEQPACSRCLDMCPTGAITSSGEHVAIDPMVCAGCGSCAAVCPSGAITYDAPNLSHLLLRIRTLAEGFAKAGGKDPRLLVHDAHGAEMIRMAARFGRGLPADVIPMELDQVSGFGHAEMLAALAVGFAQVSVLIGPKTETDALQSEQHLARVISGGDRVEILDHGDPDALVEALFGDEVKSSTVAPVLPMGERREVARLAAKALNPNSEVPITLPEGAPYGAVLVDTEACTLCLSCVSLCPSGALVDNPDMPQVKFQEAACLQCGLCHNICPENAISLIPQLDLDDAALSQKVLHEEEPFLCVECGAPFGVKSTVERILEKLAGKHQMFATSDTARMICMCDNCRVEAQFKRTDDPFSGGERPAVRRTEDYFSKRRDH
ncbi:MAG: 4Fe-4S dicluster domain-containing protein [Rhodobacteraceae bacterium]|nr:4Fe-4S dicluster domain-containing protein [Paracoccaceae bacterium]